MAVDTPATIAIVGAGPIGIEAALYARFLGYSVLLFDKGGAAEHVRRWGRVQLFTPFSMNSSPLRIAALSAQDDDFQPPPPDAQLTGAQWATEYLLPLAHSDLVGDSLREHCEVLSITRPDFLKGECIGDEARGEDEFRVLYVDGDGREHVELVDVVIDASGVFSNPNNCGPGGGLALGERALIA